MLRISLKTFLKFTIIYLKTRVVFFTFTHFRVLRVIFAVVDSNAAEAAAVADANQNEIMYCIAFFFLGVALAMLGARLWDSLDGTSAAAAAAAAASAAVGNNANFNNSAHDNAEVGRGLVIISGDVNYDDFNNEFIIFFESGA